MANTSTVTMKRSGNSSNKEEEGTTVTPLNPLTPPVRDRALVVLSLSYYIWYNVYDTCIYIYTRIIHIIPYIIGKRQDHKGSVANGRSKRVQGRDSRPFLLLVAAVAASFHCYGGGIRHLLLSQGVQGP